MTLSIVMATRNSERHVTEALQSLEAQTRPPDEIIVVDGGSTDNTRQLVSSFPRVKLINQQTDGFQNAWNEGIQCSAGDVIGFLDSDDRLRPNALASSLVLLNQCSTSSAVFGRVEFFCDDDSWPPSFREELKNGPHEADIPGCMVAHRSIFDALGPFPDDWQLLADVVWFADMRHAQVEVIRNPMTVLEKRVRNDSLSMIASSQTVYRTELLRLARRQTRVNVATKER